MRAQGAVCMPPIGNPIVCENQLPGTPASEWDIVGRRRRQHPGVCHRHQRQSRRHRSTSRWTPMPLPIASTSIGSDTTAGLGARKVATVTPSVSLPQNQPACLTDAPTGPGRLRQLGGVRVLGGPGRRPRPGSTSENWSARTPAAPATWSSSCGTIPASRTSCSRRRTRRGRPTTTTAATACTSGAPAGRAYKVSYNRPFVTRGNVVHDAPGCSATSIRWCAGSKPMATRQLYDRRRHRSTRRRAARTQGLPVVGT